MADSFENLLARTEHRDATPGGSCPDADVLAAYLDATLAPLERGVVEAHAADCSRCALQLATLVRLEDVSGSPQHAPARGWWPRLAWMVPAATAVLIGAVYVALPLRGPEAPPQRTSVDDRAQLKETKATPPEAESQIFEGTRYALPSVSTPAPVAKDIPSAAGRPAQMTDVSRPESGSANTDGATAGNGTPQVREGELQRKLEGQPAPVAETDGHVHSRSSARTNSLTLSAAKRAEPMLPLVVRSPDPGVQWRVVDGRIERSTDGGRTWLAERAPAPEAVTMGSAFSAEVCWLAAASGQVLRRTDGGSWVDVSPAPRLAIVRLDVTSSLEATVVGADGTVMNTADGGLTWMR
jgi:hypothetical protein